MFHMPQPRVPNIHSLNIHAGLREMAVFLKIPAVAGKVDIAGEADIARFRNVVIRGLSRLTQGAVPEITHVLCLTNFPRKFI